MPDIIRSLMIFKLNEDFSKEDLQKSYKKLVKKYHPDSNPKNQDWSHLKMTEINLAYEVCSKHLAIKTDLNQDLTDSPQNKDKKEQIFKRNNVEDFKHHNNKTEFGFISESARINLNRLTIKFISACERYFEYGLENRKIRNEGVRRFRYRECIRLFDDIFSSCFKLQEYCTNEYDHHVVNLFIRFSGNFYSYILLKENEIPRHPLLNRHWMTMEDYLNQSLRDYLVPHFVHNNKVHWKTSFTHCWNQLIYIKNRYPAIGRDEVFLVFYNLADSYFRIRKEEMEKGIQFFN